MPIFPNDQPTSHTECQLNAAFAHRKAVTAIESGQSENAVAWQNVRSFFHKLGWHIGIGRIHGTR